MAVSSPSDRNIVQMASVSTNKWVRSQAAVKNMVRVDTIVFDRATDDHQLSPVTLARHLLEGCFTRQSIPLDDRTA